MALDKSTLQSSLLSIFQTPGQTDVQVAQAIADAIDVFIKSGTVTTTVTGSLPIGPGTASGTGAVT